MKYIKRPHLTKPHIYKCNTPLYPDLWKCCSTNVGQYADSPRDAYRKWVGMGGLVR